MKRLTSILLLVCVVFVKGFCEDAGISRDGRSGVADDSLAERLRRIEKIYVSPEEEKVRLWSQFKADYPYSKYPYADYINASKESRQYFIIVEESLARIFFNKKDWQAMNGLLHDCPFELLNDVYLHYIIFDLRLDEPLISSEETLTLSVSIIDSFFRRLGDPDQYISGKSEHDAAIWAANAIRENSDMLAFHAGLLDQHGRYSEGLKYAEMVRPYVGLKNATFNKTYMDLLSNLHRDKDVMAYRALLRTPADIAAEHAEIRKSMIDLPAPDFDVVDTAGNHVSMSGQRGKIVVIDFWATWCYYCKLSMPGMQMAVNKYKGDEGVKLFFLATMEVSPDYRKMIARFLTEKKYDFHVLYDGIRAKTGKMDEVYNAFAPLVHSQGIPLKVIIDQKGRLRWYSIGGSDDQARTADEVDYVIQLLKAEEHSSGVGGAGTAAGIRVGSGSVAGAAAAAGKDKGLFEVRKKDDRFLFELPDSLLGRDMLVVSRIAKGAAGSRAYALGYAGDQINYNVIRFERGPAGKMYLLAPVYSELASDSSANGMLRAVTESNGTPILLTLDIKPGVDSGRGVTMVDVTELLNGDNDIFFFEQGTRRALGLGGLAADRSSVVSTQSFPMNVEIRTMKTYTKASDASLYSGGGGSAGTEAATFLLNTSVVLLPAVPMRPRYADKRVGYFSIDHTDYDANPQGVKKISVALRWRMEPKDEDSARYRRGELVEPRQPIVYYIDRATPARWVPYLIQGVNDWQAAFEKAGFKNAIMAKVAPVDDSSWSMDDARHNVIVYKPSEVANATSPQIHDPRSGEIIETHVNWYHNIMSLLHSWYMIQAGAVDPRARHMTFDDSLMGQLIRFVSSHEIGHTLGLEHNFGASATMPVELLRDTAFLRVYGHSPSIMDYSRFNYVAQPEDSVPEYLLFPRIGEYDRFAIEWGYRWRPEFSSPAEEAIAIGKEVGLKVDRNVRLWYGPENSLKDPRCQSEDLGDNAMVASEYGIKNLKRIVLGLPEWTKEPNGDYENLHNMYSEVTAQFNRYIGHVLRNIGSTMTTWRTVDQPGAVNGDVPGWKQQEAVRFLLDQLFTTPTWMVDYLTADARISESSRVDVQFTIGGAQQQAINRVLSFDVLNHLTRVKATGYTAAKLLEELSGGVFSELRKGLPVDVYRRNVQKMYVDQVVSLVSSVTGPPPAGGIGYFEAIRDGDVGTLVKDHARKLLGRIRAAVPVVKDEQTRLHLEDLVERLEGVLGKKGSGATLEIKRPGNVSAKKRSGI